MKITRHAEARMQQRALTLEDIEFLEHHATRTERGYLMTRKDVREMEPFTRMMVAKAERLVGVFLAVEDDRLITAYKARRKNLRKLLHGYQGNGVIQTRRCP